MKRRSITLGVEQVAELMQRLSKTPGLLESIGIDFGAIPSHDDVVLTNTDNRLKKQRETVASHGQKHKRAKRAKKRAADAQVARDQIRNTTREINTLKSEMHEIKHLLKQLVSKE